MWIKSDSRKSELLGLNRTETVFQKNLTKF